MSDLKQIIKEEYRKCASDPIYFLKKYCYISHPKRGKIRFILYPFQEKVLKLWMENPYSIILKSRQLGISTLSAGYSLWLMLFHEDKNVLCIATKQGTAKNMVTKVAYMYHNLPSWLKFKKNGKIQKPLEDSKLTLKFPNNSLIMATAATDDAGRSEAVSLLLIDEAAFINNIDTIWTAAQQTLATGGRCIALSTPNGTGNWFHKTWGRAEEGLTEELKQGSKQFLPIKLPWQVHPERDQAWRDEQDVLLGDPRKAAQECDCDFGKSGDVVFYSEFVEFYEKTHVREPLEKRGGDRNLWIWEPVDYSRKYMVIADVARGDGQDYSAFHILDIENNIQVGEYKGKIGTKEYGLMLVGIATEYNTALLVVENANVGWNTIQTIIDSGYRNIYFSPKRGEITSDSYFNEYADTSKMVPGFSTTSKTRPICIGKFQEAISDKGTIIQSKRLTEEMKVFIWKNGKAQAQHGYNDDLVMSYAIGQYIRDTAFAFAQKGIDLTKQMLSNTSATTTKYSGGYSGNSNSNPFEIDNPYSNDKEDIRWLLD